MQMTSLRYIIGLHSHITIVFVPHHEFFNQIVNSFANRLPDQLIFVIGRRTDFQSEAHPMVPVYIASNNVIDSVKPALTKLNMHEFICHVVDHDSNLSPGDRVIGTKNLQIKDFESRKQSRLLNQAYIFGDLISTSASELFFGMRSEGY